MLLSGELCDPQKKTGDWNTDTVDHGASLGGLLSCFDMLCSNKIFACASRFTDGLRADEEETDGMKILLGRKRFLVGRRYVMIPHL